MSDPPKPIHRNRVPAIGQGSRKGYPYYIRSGLRWPFVYSRGASPRGADLRARAPARGCPYYTRCGLASPCIVGAGLAPALEDRPQLLKSAPMGAPPLRVPFSMKEPTTRLVQG